MNWMSKRKLHDSIPFYVHDIKKKNEENVHEYS